MASRVTLRGGEYDVFRRQELSAELGAIDTGSDVDLDLSTTSLMDAGAIGLLIALRHRVQQSNPNAVVRLHNVAPIVERVLKICRADELFEFPD